MFKKIVLLLLSISFISSLNAQNSRISGKVLNSENGLPITGAIVQIKKLKLATSSDVNGQYSFNNLPIDTFTLECTFVGMTPFYQTGLKPIQGKTITQDILLSPKSSITKGATIEGKPINNDNQQIFTLEQKRSSLVTDGIPAENMRRFQEKDAGSAIKRISGASIQDNKFAIIRGLNDRYNLALINGALLPSSESDRKAFSFDLFPANILDNIIISKTASPDLPGDFAGGVISLNTKGIPDQRFFSINFTGGFNSITTYQNRFTYQGSKTDWLGFDNGSRELPSVFPAYANYPTTPTEQGDLAKLLPNNWGIQQKLASPNTSLQLAYGDNIRRKGKDYFGFTFAMTYNRNLNNSLVQRRNYTFDPDSSRTNSLALDTNYNTQVLTGFLANFTWKPFKNSELQFKNLLSQNSENQLINRFNTQDINSGQPILSQSTARWFTENRVLSSQLNGKHYLEKAKVKINWTLGYNDIYRNIPGLRRSTYVQNINGTDTSWIAPISRAAGGNTQDMGTYFFATTTEKLNSAVIDFSRSFDAKWLKTTVKLGGLMVNRSRDFQSQYYGLVQAVSNFDYSLLNLPMDSIFNPNHMGTIAFDSAGKPISSGFRLDASKHLYDNYTASSSLNAAFAMLDQQFGKRVRLIWGGRIEKYNQKLNSFRDNGDPVIINTTVLDLLPSANFILKVTEKQNLRLSASQTVNRPEYRELAPLLFYDFNTRFTLVGNDSLKRAKITNLDFRYEIFPGKGQIFTISAFHKSFTNPIEMYNAPNQAVGSSGVTISYYNAPKAVNTGLELDFRTILGALWKADDSSFFNRFTIYSNLALINSTVTISTDSNSSSRPLQGQSPYVLNGGIIYSDMKGLVISAAVNRVGERIYVIGSSTDPSIWESARTVVDLSASKSFFNQKLEIKFLAKDILANPLYFYQDVNQNNNFEKPAQDTVVAGSDLLIWKFKYPRIFSLGVTYKF